MFIMLDICKKNLLCVLRILNESDAGKNNATQILQLLTAALLVVTQLPPMASSQYITKFYGHFIKCPFLQIAS